MALAPALLGGSCEDPPGPVGGLVLVVRTFQAPPGSRFGEIERVVMQYKGVEVVHRSSASDSEQIMTVDNELRTLALPNRDLDTVVGQYEVPVGFVTQVRLRPQSVVLYLRDGTSVDLPVDNPQLPSWKQSGWKVSSEAGLVFPIVEDELTGMRGLMRFADRFVQPQSPKGLGWKIKPTIDAERFEVNPPAGEPGVYMDQITVVFKPGTTLDAINAINAEIGASVYEYPAFFRAYRMKLPPSVNLGHAYAHYGAKPEVQGILPATDYASFADEIRSEHQIANLPAAWPVVAFTAGAVGTYQVRVAVADVGVNLAHPDIYLNIAINQGELPASVFPDMNGNGTIEPDEAAVFDADDDGLITFRDLNAPNWPGWKVDDTNGNGYVDGEDLIRDPRWVNGLDEDANGLTDDLVGWDFGDGDNDPSDPNLNQLVAPSWGHGTDVSEVLGAAGDNGWGVAGTAWRVSIVPLRVTRTFAEPTNARPMPDVQVLDAFAYAEHEGIDILNASFGWHFASENADLSGSQRKYQSTIGIPQSDYDSARAWAELAFKGPPWVDPGTGLPTSRVLYSIAAGNSTMNLAQQNILGGPGELLRSASPGTVIYVGAAETAESSAKYSSYGAGVVDVWAPGTWTVKHPLAKDPVADAQLAELSKQGTSFAAPSVAGVGVLVLTVFPELRGSPWALRERLLSATVPTVDVADLEGNIHETDQPLIDAAAAVSAP